MNAQDGCGRCVSGQDCGAGVVSGTLTVGVVHPVQDVLQSPERLQLLGPVAQVAAEHVRPLQQVAHVHVVDV